MKGSGTEAVPPCVATGLRAGLRAALHKPEPLSK